MSSSSILSLVLFSAAQGAPLIRVSVRNMIPLILGLAVVILLMILGRVPLRYNLRNLTVRWRATFMTALAFTLVVGLLTVMLAFVNGMYRLTQQSGDPRNVMLLSDGATDETFSNLGFSDVGDIPFQEGVDFDPQTNERLCSKETYIVANQEIEDPAPGRPLRRLLQIRCIDEPEMSARVHDLELLPGGAWFGGEGAIEIPGGGTAFQAVIGEGIARELGRDRRPALIAAAQNKDRLEVGDLFSLSGRKWYVTGIIKARGSTFDSEIWAKRGLVDKHYREETYSTITVRAKDAQAALQLRNLFKNTYKKAALNPILETEYFEKLAAANGQFLFAIVFLTVIIAVGGVMGIMNTMFAAVSQRRKDVGVLRILGFSRGEVMFTFLLESLVLALLGGAIGCLLGCLAHGYRVTSILTSGQTTKFVVLEMLVTGDTISIALLVTLAMGLLGGAIPAFFAMLVRPLESLR